MHNSSLSTTVLSTRIHLNKKSALTPVCSACEGSTFTAQSDLYAEFDTKSLFFILICWRGTVSVLVLNVSLSGQEQDFVTSQPACKPIIFQYATSGM